ncbi:MAG: CpaD family pilus assembly lipoprotein [Rhodospirillaceae bacterium]
MRTIPTLCLVAALSGLGAALGACTTPPAGTPEATKTHVIRPQLETFRVKVPLARATMAQPLPGQFVEEYYRRGRGPMTVVVPNAHALASGRRLAAWLEERLIPASVGQAVPSDPVIGDTANDGTIEVFFKAYVAVVPECGDWRGGAGFNPENLPHTDFGCATQRNIGLMLSDPGELLGAPTTGPADTPRLVNTLDRYRTGQGIGTQAPPGEITTIEVDR